MNKLVKCVIPAAGYGTRFLPVTKSVPKELMPILNKPLIHYSIEECLSAQIGTFMLVINDHKEAIRDYFNSDHYMNLLMRNSDKKRLLSDLNFLISNGNFEYIYQKEMLGLGAAISLAEEFIDNENFAVLLPDDLCQNNEISVLQQMTEISNKYPDCCIIAIEEVSKDSVNSYGIVDLGNLLIRENQSLGDVFQVKDLVEKPNKADAPSNFAIIGRYILTPNIFNLIKLVKKDHNEEIQITNALKILARENKVIAYKFKGQRFDCGSYDGFVHANNFYFNNY